MATEKLSPEKRSRYVSIVTAVIAAVGTLIAFFSSFYANNAREWELRARDMEARTQLAEVQSRIDEQRAELAARERELAETLAATRAQVKGLTERSSASTPTQLSAAVSSQIAQLLASTAKLSTQQETANNQQQTLEKRLKEIEAVILSDPTKALSLPLLQRDFQALSQQLDRGLASAKADSDRVYDLMKWVLGLMGVVSLSLVGTAVGNVFKKESPKDPVTRRTGTAEHPVESEAKEKLESSGATGGVVVPPSTGPVR